MLTTQLTTNLHKQKVSRRNSVVKTIRVPEVLLIALRDWARNAGCSMNALVRKALTTRFHNPNLPTPSGRATRYIHVRVLHSEWELLKAYTEAWKMPMWKALFLLLSRPYCISDHPRATCVLHSVLHNDRSIKEDYENMNECTCVNQIHDNPAFKGLIEIGVTNRVASDIVQRYDSDLLLFVTDKVSRNPSVRFPAAFAVWWLKSGLAQWHYERELAIEERAREKANEPLAPYHRKWSEMKQELGTFRVPDPDEWQRGLEFMRQAFSWDKSRDVETHICITCGKPTKNPTSTGQCLRCFELSLKSIMQGGMSQ